MKRSYDDVLYNQHRLAAYNTIGQAQDSYSSDPLAKCIRFDNNNLHIFPHRPGEKACAHYMLTRTCKFGERCLFDHPIWVSEGGIPGKPDCPYFLKTTQCKFGPRCKFNHPKDKVVTQSLTGSSSLPERPTEPPCAFYMKTGICKFGATCKFNHPKDVQLAKTSERNKIGDEYPTTTITPTSLHNSKGLPIRMGEVDCPFCLKTGSCKYGYVCRYNHPEIYVNRAATAISHAFVPSPVTHFNFGVNPAAPLLQSYAAHSPLVMAQTFYTQRPGEMECGFYTQSFATPASFIIP